MEEFERAAHLLHERCVGAAPELGFARQMILGHYMAVGAWDRATAESHRFSIDAAAHHRGRLRGDEAGEAEMRDARNALEECGVSDLAAITRAQSPLLDE